MQWFSFGINAEHGQARTRSDIARILATIFEDPEWRTMPLREIARHTRIAWSTVRLHHARLSGQVNDSEVSTPLLGKGVAIIAIPSNGGHPHSCRG